MLTRSRATSPAASPRSRRTEFTYCRPESFRTPLGPGVKARSTDPPALPPAPGVEPRRSSSVSCPQAIESRLQPNADPAATRFQRLRANNDIIGPTIADTARRLSPQEAFGSVHALFTSGHVRSRQLYIRHV